MTSAARNRLRQGDRNEQAEHDGDCTGAIHTCARCIADEALREAREIHDD